MQNYLIKNISIVNEGLIQQGDLLIKNGRIEKILPQITSANADIKRSMVRENFYFRVL
jgi:dihydroorotase-like cyclic amidohydrolase